MWDPRANPQAEDQRCRRTGRPGVQEDRASWLGSKTRFSFPLPFYYVLGPQGAGRGPPHWGGESASLSHWIQMRIPSRDTPRVMFNRTSGRPLPSQPDTESHPSVLHVARITISFSSWEMPLQLRFQDSYPSFPLLSGERARQPRECSGDAPLRGQPLHPSPPPSPLLGPPARPALLEGGGPAAANLPREGNTVAP